MITGLDGDRLVFSGPANFLLGKPESWPSALVKHNVPSSGHRKSYLKLKTLANRFLIPQMYKIERVFVDTRKRKRRTSLEGAVRSALESYFIKCPKPNTQEITHISDDLGLERDVSASS